MKQSISGCTAKLSKKGIKLTRQRNLLMRQILHFNDHFSADLLYVKLKVKGIDISRATVYRTLALFEECGIIKKALKDEDISYYEVSTMNEHHDHLICVECGEIIEFCSEKIEKIQKEIYSNYNYVPTSHQLILKGMCEKCRNKQNEKNTDKSGK
jgi:Fur family ferric uptake transcriptional regulator